MQPFCDGYLDSVIWQDLSIKIPKHTATNLHFCKQKQNQAPED